VERVSQTNNASERALRTAVQWRKIIFGTRSEHGERAVERPADDCPHVSAAGIQHLHVPNCLDCRSPPLSSARVVAATDSDPPELLQRKTTPTCSARNPRISCSGVSLRKAGGHRTVRSCRRLAARAAGLRRAIRLADNEVNKEAGYCCFLERRDNTRMDAEVRLRRSR